MQMCKSSMLYIHAQARLIFLCLQYYAVDSSKHDANQNLSQAVVSCKYLSSYKINVKQLMYHCRVDYFRPFQIPVGSNLFVSIFSGIHLINANIVGFDRMPRSLDSNRHCHYFKSLFQGCKNGLRTKHTCRHILPTK